MSNYINKQQFFVEDILTRNCPTCNIVLNYKTKYYRHQADKSNSSCRSCKLKSHYKTNKPHNFIDGTRQKTWAKRNPEKARARQIKCKYGLTLAQYNEMYLKQLGLCAACHNPFGDETPHIDHCHTTGKVRGLLHPNCNKLLGLAKDDAQVLLSCSEYLALTPSD